MPSKITVIDRPTCRVLHSAIEEALKKVAEEYGLTATVKHGRFGPNQYGAKFEFNTPTANGTPSDFERYAPLYGLKPEDLGKEFLFRGEPYTVVNIMPSRPKYPILASRRKDSKQFCLPQGEVVSALHPAAKAAAAA